MAEIKISGDDGTANIHNKNPHISVVSTLYYSAPYLFEFYQRIKETLTRIAVTHEIIFVNDGSPDHSLDLAMSILETDPCVRIIDLSRNFGHHKAIMTGLAYAKGDLVFLIDCDLEESPEILEQFYREWQLSGEVVDMYYGVQEKREGWIGRRIFSKAFQYVFNAMSGLAAPDKSCMARLMSRRFVQALLRFRDQNVFLLGLWEAAGFNRQPILMRKSYKGTSTYTFHRKLALAIDGITSFSSKPIFLLCNIGLGISLLAFLYVVFLVYSKWIYGIEVSGYTSIIVSIWLLGGITILSVGVVGLYVGKIFVETKKRPLTVVKKTYGY